MTLDEYQHAAARTREAPFPERERLMVMALGLCGEAGEMADLVKKAMWHGRALTNAEVTNELGDVLWYLADIATACGLNLSDIAKQNIAKLHERYPSGFTVGGGIRG